MWFYVSTDLKEELILKTRNAAFFIIEVVRQITRSFLDGQRAIEGWYFIR